MNANKTSNAQNEINTGYRNAWLLLNGRAWAGGKGQASRVPSQAVMPARA
jgi:hypothetical protein